MEVEIERWIHQWLQAMITKEPLPEAIHLWILATGDNIQGMFWPLCHFIGSPGQLVCHCAKQDAGLHKSLVSSSKPFLMLLVLVAPPGAVGHYKRLPWAAETGQTQCVFLYWNEASRPIPMKGWEQCPSWICSSPSATYDFLWMV